MKKVIILAVLLGSLLVSAQRLRTTGGGCTEVTVEGHWEWVQVGVLGYPVWISTYTYKDCPDQ